MFAAIFSKEGQIRNGEFENYSQKNKNYKNKTLLELNIKINIRYIFLLIPQKFEFFPNCK